MHLESPEDPTPVKKQRKYNITRWAVTGRDDLGINTACWRRYATLSADPRATDADWRELCELWSSDYRTHITDARWNAYQERLSAGDRFQTVPDDRQANDWNGSAGDPLEDMLPGSPAIQWHGPLLTIRSTDSWSAPPGCGGSWARP